MGIPKRAVIAKAQWCKFMRGIPLVPKLQLRLMSLAQPGQLLSHLIRLDQGAKALEDL